MYRPPMNARQRECNEAFVMIVDLFSTSTMQSIVAAHAAAALEMTR